MGETCKLYNKTLSLHSANAKLLAQLPSLAARMWSARQETIANDARQLARRLEEQKTLNTRLITAKFKDEISQNAWQKAPFHRKIEMQKVFYPQGLVYSPKTHFFDPGMRSTCNNLRSFGVDSCKFFPGGICTRVFAVKGHKQIAKSSNYKAAVALQCPVRKLRKEKKRKEVVPFLYRDPEQI